MRVRDCKGERSRWRRSENTPQAWSEAKAGGPEKPDPPWPPQGGQGGEPSMY